MQKKKKESGEPRRVKLTLKVDRMVLAAAEAEFAKAGLDINAAIQVFLAHAAEKRVEEEYGDEAHTPFSTVGELMEHLEERGAKRERIRFETTNVTPEKAP